jgi:methyltransferase (TIGR00027 family)
MAGMSPVALTSRWVAANRARESEHPDRLFDDPYAAALAGEAGFTMLAEGRKVWPEGQPEGPDPYLSIRTRFFDDALLEVVNDRSVRQVVLLAAGMDARSFRLAWPSGVTVYEIDRDEVFDHKEAVLRRLNAVPACTRRVVRADLERDWIRPLVQAGFVEGQPAAFLAEGLTMYLDNGAVTDLLTALRRAACAGSWLGIDFVSAELLSSPYLKPLHEMLERLGCPWRFGTSEPEQLLARYGGRRPSPCPGSPGRTTAAGLTRSPLGMCPAYLAAISSRRAEPASEVASTPCRAGSTCGIIPMAIANPGNSARCLA